MKLIRVGKPGNEVPGLILDDGRRIDASAFGSDYDATTVMKHAMIPVAAKVDDEINLNRL